MIFDHVSRLIQFVLGLSLVMSTAPSKQVVWANDINNDNKSTAESSITRGGELSLETSSFPGSNGSELWVDAYLGDDENDGSTLDSAFRSIQKAADTAGPGTTIHILPGIYREAVYPAQNGLAGEPILFRSENGPGTAIIRGSEQSNALVWKQLTTNTIGLSPGVNPGNLYYADLSEWELNGSPRFVVQLGSSGDVIARLPLAREPDWPVATEWKQHEFWWTADGGSTVASCDPARDPNSDCDTLSRSTIKLTDGTDDSTQDGIESGNLTTLGNLVGAALVALDTVEGHYIYRREIVHHDVTAGRVTLDRLCEFDAGSGKPGLGWGSKYYLENHPALLDSPGEWWYDVRRSRIYIWPPLPGNPGALNIEISRRDTGFFLSNRSYITLDGLTLEFFNRSAVHQSQSCPGCGSYHNVVQNAILRYANIGIEMGQGTGYLPNVTDGFMLENSEVGHMDSLALHLNYWWPGGTSDTFTHAGIVNTVIRNNELYDLGFRSDNDNADGVQFNYADKLRFEDNYVHHIAHNGIMIFSSIIQSTKEFGFTPDEILIGEILIKDNIIEKACLLAADCGALKIGGRVPANHVFRDLLITGNIFRNNIGWSYISEQRERWSGGAKSDVRGMGGFGLYVDFASGIHAYRNIAYNNASSGFHLYSHWWDGDIVYYNNIAANSLNGIRLDGYASYGNVNTDIANNIVINNEAYGILIYHANVDWGKFTLDRNLYYGNGWRANKHGGMLKPGNIAIYGPNKYHQTLDAIQAHTPWEDHGVAGDPRFWNYSFADHDLFDGSWPDFYLTSASASALDRGTSALPQSLKALLDAFDVTDLPRGQAYDIGSYEGGFTVQTYPPKRFLCLGGVTHAALWLDPPDLPYNVTLSVTSPSSLMDFGLRSSTLTTDEVVILNVSSNPSIKNNHPIFAYTVPVVASGAGFVETINVRLFVGSIPICPHIIQRNNSRH